MSANETHTIIKNRRGGRTSTTTGTLAELTEHFAYTLKCGKDYNPKINTKPSTIKGLLSALNKSLKETQRNSRDPESYEMG